VPHDRIQEFVNKRLRRMTDRISNQELWWKTDQELYCYC